MPAAPQCTGPRRPRAYRRRSRNAAAARRAAWRDSDERQGAGNDPSGAKDPPPAMNGVSSGRFTVPDGCGRRRRGSIATRRQRRVTFNTSRDASAVRAYVKDHYAVRDRGPQRFAPTIGSPAHAPTQRPRSLLPNPTRWLSAADRARPAGRREFRRTAGLGESVPGVRPGRFVDGLTASHAGRRRIAPSRSVTPARSGVRPGNQDGMAVGSHCAGECCPA